MDRRSFFKVIGALSAASAFPATSLIDAAKEVPGDATQLGLIREIFAHDICQDLMLVRYDVLTKDKTLQLGVDMRWYPEKCNSEEFRNEQREIAKTFLENEMKHRGIAWSDLIPMEVPPGYKAPTWTA